MDNFVDKAVDNMGITVENVWKRGIKGMPKKKKYPRIRKSTESYGDKSIVYGESIFVQTAET